MKKLLSALLTASTLLPHTMTYAETRPGTVSASAGWGHYFYNQKRDLKNSGLAFGALGYNFCECWGIEATIFSARPKIRGSDEDHRTASLTTFTVDGIFRFASYPFLVNAIEPYVFAGVGITGLNPNKHNAHNEGNINAGLGVQAFFHRSIALRVDVRDLYTIVGGKNDVIADVGVNFLFG